MREASIEELRTGLENVQAAVAASALTDLFPDGNGDFSLLALHAVWGN